MDTHDLARDRIPPLPTSDSSTTSPSSPTPHPSAIPQILSHLPPRALIIGIETDGLFTTTEQRELASHIPEAELVIIPSPDGHDGFLLEFERINGCLVEFLRREFPEFYVGGEGGEDGEGEGGGFDVKKTSIFGEAEVDVAMW
jgi:homoserine O-acetyltransferase